MFLLLRLKPVYRQKGSIKNQLFKIRVILTLLFLFLYFYIKAQSPLVGSGSLSISMIADYMVTLGEISSAERNAPLNIAFLNKRSHLTNNSIPPYHISDWYGYGVPIYANGKITKQKRPYAPSGVYTIDPDGTGGNAAFQAYIDMTGDAGGWTLVFKRSSGNQVDNNAHTIANLLVLDTSNASFSAAAINAISGQSLGVEYELRLEGAYSSSLMKATEPFYVGQINGHQVTIKYDCNRDGIYDITKVWNDWSDERVVSGGALESSSWIRDWVWPQNSQCNTHNGGNVMQWWAGSKIETPLNGANYGPITETATGYLHTQPVKLWVR